MATPTQLIGALTLLFIGSCVQAGCNPRASESLARRSAAVDSGPPTSTFALPLETMPAAALAVDGFTHVEVMRVQRDWGKREFEIVMDAWVSSEDPGRVEMVRLWWFKANKQGERGPFSEKTKRHFDIVYTRPDDARWVVDMVADDKRFTFVVQADEAHGISALATVTVPGGGQVENCRVHGGEVRASTVLGIPNGIEAFEVTCTGVDGVEYRGTLG
ncbi:MAG: hypothetical protein AAGA54_29385 [Myxococcota bacterium]